MQRSATAPLKKLERQEIARCREAKAEWDQMDKEKRGPEPTARRHILNDSTIEATASVLADNDHGLLLDRDEFAGWFGAMDKYSAGRGAAADRAFWLQAWNGGPYTVDRVSRASLRIPNLSVSILGGIQPDAIRRIAGDTVDDGLLQRLIPVSVGPATIGEDTPDTGDTYRNYEALVVRLTKLPERIVKFDAAAQTIRRDFERYANTLTKLEILSPRFAAFCGKLDGLFARIALIFHCCDHINLSIPTEATEIPEQVMESTARRVETLMREFVIPHALHFYLELAAETTVMDDARAIAGYILAKNVERLTFGILTRDCWPCRKKSREDVIRMIEPLEMLGWLTPDHPLIPRAWTVDPRVHQEFAARAERERERRQQVRQVINQTIKTAVNE